MRNLNKRAMGESITTFALIVIAIGAIALAWYSISTVLSVGDLQKSPEFNCLLNNKLSLNQEDQQARLASACYDAQTQNTKITIQTKVELPSIAFQIGENSDTKVYGCGSETSCTNCQTPLPGQAQTYYIPSTESTIGRQIIFSVESCEISAETISNC